MFVHKSVMHVGFLLLLCILVQAETTGQSLLEELYNTMGGPYWHREGRDYSTWTSGANVCSWAGITCDGTKNVQTIDLGYSNVTGTLPRSGWDFPRLTQLYGRTCSVLHMPNARIDFFLQTTSVESSHIGRKKKCQIFTECLLPLAYHSYSNVCIE